MLQIAIPHAISKEGAAVIGLLADVSELPAEENLTANHFFYIKLVISPDDTQLNNLAELITYINKITLFCEVGVENADS